MTGRRPAGTARRWLLVCLTLIALSAVAAGAVTGTDVADRPTASGEAVDRGAVHGNHVSTDAQVVADGRVLVESLFIIEDGWLVIHRDDGGSLGEPIGAVWAQSGFSRAVVVDTDESFWSDRDGPVTLHATLHADDGDGQFDAADDDVLQSPATGRAVSTFRTRPGSSTAHLAARSFSGQRIATPEVTVRRAALPDEGSLIVHAATDELGVGERIGARNLSAGVHENASVAIDEAFLESLPYDVPTRLWVTVSVDGAPVTVGEDPVRTLFTVRRVNESAVDDEWSVNTPEPTTVEATTTTTDVVTATATDTATDGEDAGAPGATALAALLGIAAILLAAVARRRS